MLRHVSDSVILASMTQDITNQLRAARMALAYIRDKAESSTVTRSHLKEIAKAGILKSGGPVTLKEAAADMVVLPYVLDVSLPQKQL